jgi:hypothetical protein
MELRPLARALKEAGADKEERRDIIENENWLDEYELHDMYDDLLNENGEVRIGSLSYQPCHVLRDVDPIAYRCGYRDFTDNYTEIIVAGKTYYTEAIS